MANKKAAKKVAASRKKTDLVESMPVTPLPRKKISKKILAFVVIVLLAVGVLYYFRGWFVVAMVNGEPISRMSLITKLEQQRGKQLLDSVISRKLILQEARKQKATVSEDEIQKEIKTIEENLSKQGQNLDGALKMQGLTREDLKEQITINKLVDKMLSKDIQVTDKEINQYIEQNASLYTEETPEKQKRDDAITQLKESKMNEKAQKWLEDLRKKAKINYFVTY